MARKCVKRKRYPATSEPPSKSSFLTRSTGKSSNHGQKGGARPRIGWKSAAFRRDRDRYRDPPLLGEGGGRSDDRFHEEIHRARMRSNSSHVAAANRAAPRGNLWGFGLSSEWVGGVDAFVTNKPIRLGSIQLAVGEGIENEEAFLFVRPRWRSKKKRKRRRKKGRSEMAHESRGDTRERGWSWLACFATKSYWSRWDLIKGAPLSRVRDRGSGPSLAPRKINRWPVNTRGEATRSEDEREREKERERTVLRETQVETRFLAD